MMKTAIILTPTLTDLSSIQSIGDIDPEWPGKKQNLKKYAVTFLRLSLSAMIVMILDKCRRSHLPFCIAVIIRILPGKDIKSFTTNLHYMIQTNCKRTQTRYDFFLILKLLSQTWLFKISQKTSFDTPCIRVQLKT